MVDDDDDGAMVVLILDNEREMGEGFDFVYMSFE
jgi:hypothetical protein